MEAGLRSGVVTAQELEDQLGRSKGRRGVAILRRYLVLDLQSLARAKSHLEGRFLRFCEEEGLPAPEVNAFLGGYEVDASWPGTKVIVELDSWSFHRSRAAFERDRAKWADLTAQGFRVIVVTDRRLRQERRKLAAALRALLS